MSQRQTGNTRHPLDDLRTMALVHVEYEITRLAFWSHTQVAEAAFVPGPNRSAFATLVNQATLECALLHLRNVIDFLLNPPPTNKRFETDVVADDYFDVRWTGRPEFLLGHDQDEHGELMTDLNRRLAHLSTHRLKDQTSRGGFDWADVLVAAPRVLSTFEQFASDLGEVHPDRAGWFHATLAQVQSILSQQPGGAGESDR